MMPTKFSIIIDVLMMYIFMRRGLYSSQHKNIHTHQQHHIITAFLFSESAMQNSRNIIRLSLSLSTAACHFQFPLLRPNFPSPIKLLRNNKTNPSNSSAKKHQHRKYTHSNRVKKLLAHTHDVNLILHFHQCNWLELKSLLLWRTRT